MAFSTNEQNNVVNVTSSTAAGSDSIATSTDYDHHQVLITMSAQAEVKLQWSVDNSNWADCSSVVDTTESSIFLEGLFPYLRISYAGTNGHLSVDVYQWKVS
jgi:hypothetical protein